MKHIAIITVSLLAIVGLVHCASNTTTKAVSKGDSREKRSYVPINFQSKSKIQRRIATGYYNEPREYYPSGGEQNHFSESDPIYQQPQGYNTHSHYPQYLEAPEPIIEIIIKESNDSIPLEAPQIIPSQKKKKEQVQVFYVKYQKDPHKGVLIDKPVPALSPTAYHQENEEEEILDDQPLIVTLPPPVKTTTLRTIIRPDSEKYHSNSGIHVTFNTEDKNQQGHQIQEENEESAVQPVVALPTSQSHFHNNAQQNFHQSSKEFHSRFGQTARYNHQHPNDHYQPQPLNQGLVNGNQQLPFVNTPNQPFRNVPNFHNQGLNAQASNNRPPFHQPPPQSQLTNYQNQQIRYQDQERNLIGPSGAPFAQQPPSFAPPQQFRQGPPPPNYHQRPAIASHPPPPFNNNIPSSVPTPVRFPTGPQNPNQYQPIKQRPHPSQVPPSQQPPLPSPPQQQHHHQQQHSQSQHPQSQHPQSYQQQHQNHQQHSQSHQQHSQNHQQPSQNLQQHPQNLQIPPHRPIPIPLHQYTEQQLPHTQQQQPFNRNPPPPPNFHQQNHQNYQQFNKPPQPPQHHQQPQQVPQFNQPQQQRPKEPLQPPVHNAQQFNYNPQQNQNLPVQGGLVQQAAPNLSREQPQPHHHAQVQQQQQRFQQFNENSELSLQQHQQNVDNLVPGGELIPSVAKYEQHIIEQAPNYNFPDQQSQYVFPSSTPQPLALVSPQPKANIGPLANEIGHLNTKTSVAPLRSPTPSQPSFDNSFQHQQYLQQQFTQILQDPPQNSIQPQIIPNSQPVQPGQSVSTHYSEVFPTFEQQRNYYKPISNQAQDQLQQVVNINGRNNNHNSQQSFETSSIYTPTTHVSTTPKSTTAKQITNPPTTTQRTAKKPANINLPDEVPDDLREQLLSSGILDNADISVLDYDKLGDTPLENLPPEHLANFFSAGGGAQISSSNQVLTVVRPNGEKIALDYNNKEKYNKKKSEEKTLPTKQNVDLKVVRFDPSTQKAVSEKYIKNDSTVLPSVDIGDQQFNRYLPLKINGAQFPIPDVAELRGKKITSVVVLAPVDNLQDENVQDDGRYERDAVESKQVKFIAGDALKQLIKKPTKENFKKWLEREANTEIDFQSVVLLVAKDQFASDDEKEIFMYDISTQAVNKLSGELSSAFVNVAEANAQTENIDSAQIIDSGIVEQMDSAGETTPKTKDEEEETTYHFDSRSDDEFVEKEIQSRLDELEAEPSDFVETRVRYELPPNHKYDSSDVVISSGYSVIKS